MFVLLMKNWKGCNCSKMRKRDVEISLLSIPLPDIEVEKVKSLLLLSKKVNKQQVYELSQCIQLMLFNHANNFHVS